MPLFHAGGAANLRLHDFHDLSFLRTFFGLTHELDFRDLGSLLAIAGIIPAAWRISAQVWREGISWLRRFFISSITIPAGDPLNRSISLWLLKNVIEPRRLRFHTARTELSAKDLEPGASLKKTQRSLQYLPHWDTAWFWHGNTVLSASRSLDSFHTSLGDPTYDGFGGEELTLSCVGRSSSPIRNFIQTCRRFADAREKYYVIVYGRDRYGMSWKPKTRKPLRRLETVHFDNDVRQALMKDLRTYLDPRTQKLYQSRSMPYRRGYLFYGPPGTGKSSLSTAIAGELGLDLYEVKIPSIANDGDLEQMFQEIPPRCIVLLEDIDAVWTGRDNHRYEHITSDDSSTNSLVSNVTLSGLLNVLDGVGSQEGRIVVMTTNFVEHLDTALIRPGRVDFKVYLGNISRPAAKEMFMRMFEPDLLKTASISAKADHLDDHVSLEKLRMLAAQFANEVPEDTFTPSQLQGFFQLHLENIMQATSNIREWVREQLVMRSEKLLEVP